MRTEDELMIITMEECAELSQACAKLLRFGHSNESVAHFKQELGDVMAMIQLFVHYDRITEEELLECSMKKLMKLQKWSSLPIDLKDFRAEESP